MSERQLRKASESAGRTTQFVIMTTKRLNAILERKSKISKPKRKVKR